MGRCIVTLLPCSEQEPNQQTKMAMWADNVKFVKDIIDSKYQKIDTAVVELNDSIEGLQKDSSCHKSKEHLNTSLRTLELVQPTEIQTLMDTIISDVNGKEKDILENEMKEKLGNREAGIAKAQKAKADFKV